LTIKKIPPIFPGMDIRKEVLDAEWTLESLGVSVRQFCIKARIHPETWREWREGALPQLRKWMQAQATLTAIRTGKIKMPEIKPGPAPRKARGLRSQYRT
jgi:hypothetical protein